MLSKLDCSQPLYLAHAKENASETSAKHAGPKEQLSTQSSLPFALATSSLAIVSAGSTIEKIKYEKLDGCEQAIEIIDIA